MDRNQRLDEIITAFLKAEEAGENPDPAAWLARHPDLAAELSEFFATHQRLARAVAPLRDAADMPAANPQDATTLAPGETPALAPTDAVLGRVPYFGDYELLQEIARGGMGVVFKARQVSVNRVVALKMILAGQLASAHDMARFKAEAEAAANLDHPHILPIYEVSEFDGHPYFTMKLVEGGSLDGSATQRQGTLGSNAQQRWAAEIVEQVARAIHYAHQRGILHRDLKPSNILMGPAQTPPITYVADFGLAKRIAGDSRLTQSGAIVGTPSYMPPEQARADKVLTTAADVYSLGAILYDLLTGRPPFRAATPLDTVLQVIDKEPEPPRRLQPSVAADLETICLKCLSKEPGRRYGSAEALAEDLRRFLGGEPISARPVGRVERAWRWCRRNPAVASLTAAALLFLVVGSALSTYFAVQAESRYEDVQKASAAKDDALLQSDSLRLVARSEFARLSDPTLGLLLAVAGAERGRPRGLLHNNALLGALQSSHEECIFDGRQVLQRLRQGEDDKDLHVCLRHAEFSADGRRVLTIGESFGLQRPEFMGQAVHIWDVRNSNLLKILQVPYLSIASAHFSPDGRRVVTLFGSGAARLTFANGRVALFTGRAARVWDADSGQELAVLRGHSDQIVSAEFSPDGKKIVTASHDKTARVWDAATGQQLAVLQGDPFSLASAEFSADGLRVLTQSSGTLTATSIGDDALPADVDPPWPQEKVAQARDSGGGSFGGRNFGSGIPDAPARLWDAGTGRLIAALESTKDKQQPNEVDQTTYAKLSADGSQIATGYHGHITGSGDLIHELKFWDGRTGQFLKSVERRFRQIDAEPVQSLSWSSDGTRLLVLYKGKEPFGLESKGGDQLLEVLETRTGNRLGQLKFTVERKQSRSTLYVNRVRSAVLAPDGQRVLFLVGDDSKVQHKLWSIDFGERQPGLTPPFDRFAHLWEVQTGKESLLAGHTNDLSTASFSRDGRFVLSASVDGTGRVWDVGPEAVVVLRGETNGLGLARFSPDGRRMVTAHGRIGSEAGWDLKERAKEYLGQQAHLWDAAGAKEVAVLRGLAGMDDAWRKRLLGNIVVVQFHPAGDRLLTVSSDVSGRMDQAGGKEQPIPYTPVRVWDAAGKEVLALKGLTEQVQTASFSPSGRLLLTVSSGLSQDTVLTESGAQGRMDQPRKEGVQIWDALTGERLRRVGRPGVLFADAVWSPDSRRVFTFDERGGQIWDAVAGVHVADLEGGGASAGVVSPDGTLVLGFVNVFQSDRQMARLWDAATGKLRATLLGHDEEIHAAAFHPDGTRLVTASRDGTARLWDASTGKELQVLRGHEGPVRAVVMSPDGKWIATASEDRTARIWDAATGKEWMTLAGHQGPVFAADFSPDNARLVTASRDGTARIWPVDPLPMARQRRPRDFTEVEKKRFDIGPPAPQ